MSLTPVSVRAFLTFVFVSSLEASSKNDLSLSTVSAFRRRLILGYTILISMSLKQGNR